MLKKKRKCAFWVPFGVLYVLQIAHHNSNLHIFPYSCCCQTQSQTLQSFAFGVSFERFTARDKKAHKRKTYQCGSGI